MFNFNSILKIKVAYLIVFVSLVFWALFSYHTMTQLISSQEVYAKLINISGKQRMLSQKTTLIAKRSFETKNKELINHTRELYSLMKADHDFIINNLSSKYMENVYFNKKDGINTQVQKYLVLLDDFINKMSIKKLQNIEEYSFSLLPKLNYAVYQFEKESNEKTEELKTRELLIALGTIITLILEAIFIIIPAIRLNEKKENELIQLNQNLIHKINQAVKEVKEKDHIINEQTKMIFMRKILNNIGHQWRQPLSAITTCASGIKLLKDYEELNDKILNDNLDHILNQSKYLSNTIDRFIGFFEDENKCNIYKFDNLINKALENFQNEIETYNINIIRDIKDFNYYYNENKMLNILIQIIDNAIEVLKKSQDEKYIFINIYKDKNVVIEIIDNAGGIDDTITNNIFEPYFTTKLHVLGKGLGLYIVRETIERMFDGKITANNETYKYNETKYCGAKFKIILPFRQINT